MQHKEISCSKTPQGLHAWPRILDVISNFLFIPWMKETLHLCLSIADETVDMSWSKMKYPVLSIVTWHVKHIVIERDLISASSMWHHTSTACHLYEIPTYEMMCCDFVDNEVRKVNFAMRVLLAVQACWMAMYSSAFRRSLAMHCSSNGENQTVSGCGCANKEATHYTKSTDRSLQIFCL